MARFLCFIWLLLLVGMWVQHPFSMGSVLLLIRISLRVGSGRLFIRWYGFVLFLIFVGGLLVLFRYSCALIPKFKIKTFYRTRKILAYTSGILVLRGFICFVKKLRLITRLVNLVGVRGGSSKVGVLITSFVWDIRIIWAVLVLFFVMVLASYICKTQKFPLRAFKTIR